MNVNTSKGRNFYTQGQRFAARVLFIVWLLVSGSPESALATPKRQSAMTPATTTSPGDPSLASTPPTPPPGGALELPPDSPGAFWGGSIASSPSIDAALQRAHGLRARTIDKLVGRFWGPRPQTAPGTLAGPVAEGIIEGTSSAVVAFRTATPTLEELMSREEVPEIKTLVAALDAAPPQDQRQWIEKAVEWFDGRSTATLCPAAIRDYAALAHVRVTPEHRDLLENYLHSLCNKVRDGSFGEKPFIQALAYSLEHLDLAVFNNDATSLFRLAENLLEKLKRSKNPFTPQTYPTARITLEALFQTLFLAQKIDPGQLDQKEGSLYQNFSSQLEELTQAQYYPVSYHVQVLKQTLELLAKIEEPTKRQQVWKGCQAVFRGLEGSFYFYQGINKLLPFSSLEVLSKLNPIPFKSSYSAFMKSYAIIKEILPKSESNESCWYEHLLTMCEHCAKILHGDTNHCAFLINYLKIQQLGGPQLDVAKGAKAFRFGLVLQLQLLALSGPTLEVRKSIIDQLQTLAQPASWGVDADVMAGLLDSLALVATQSQAGSDREAEATMAREALEGFTADASAAQWLAGETLSAKLDRLREQTTERPPSDEERLFIQVKKILPSTSSISPSETRAQLVSYYSKTGFPYVKSLIFEEQSPKHVKDLKCQLMLLEQKLVKQEKEGAGDQENHIAKHHERRFEWVKTRIGSEDLFKKRSIRPGDPEQEISRILLTGDPGTGKTTLSKQLAYQWSQGQWGQEFHTLYLLPVRSLQQSEYDGTRYNRERTLGTAIVNNCFVHELPATEDEYNRLRDHIEEELEKPTTLLILDGLDERAGSSEQILTQAQAGTHKLLMLSRPYGIETERQRVDIEIEHVGFNRGQLERYVQKELRAHTDLAKGLLDYIGKHANIREIAHVPVNLQILCALWQDEDYGVDREELEQGSLPGLYRLFTEFTWKRYKERAKEDVSPQAREDLFDKLGQIALGALEDGEVLIRPGRINKTLSNSATDADEIKQKCQDTGFLLLQYVGGDIGRKSGFYEFPHLTFQEYFAGCTLARKFLSEDEEEREEASDFLSDHQYESQYGRTLSFLAGEVSRKPKGVKRIKELLNLLGKSDQELLGLQHLCLQLRVIHEWLCIASDQEAKRGMNKLEDEFHVLSSLEAWFVRAFAHVRLEGYDDAYLPGRRLLGLLKSSLQTFGSVARHAPELLELFKKTAQGPHGAVRLAAISSLGGALAVVDDEVRAMLQTMVDDRHESMDIQHAARKALSQATRADATQDETAVGGGTAQGSLGEARESASQSPGALLEQLRQAAKDADDESNRALRSSRGSLVQAVAAATQEKFGALLDLLLPAAKDQDGFVRAAALEALLKAPIDALLAFYWSTPDTRLIPYITPRLYHTPLVVSKSVRSGLQRVLLYAVAGQAREWRKPQGVVADFERHVQDAVSQLSYVESKLSARIDKSVWEHYFGAVGEEPPLPDDLEAIMDSPCPFWGGRQVRDTHMLVLIPSHVAGQPLTLDSLGGLIQSPKGDGYGTKYRNYESYAKYVRPAIGSQASGSSYWVLMTKDVLPESRNKSYEDQRKLVADHANRTGLSYEVPGGLEASIVMLLHHVRSGERLYSLNPVTYTRCRDKGKDGDPVVVGGFSSGGLIVRIFYYDSYNFRGVAGLRKF